ncbi:hypothetical protein GW17_00025694 [Ensete ventricosum]|nr:hypothetical protein GW17_00025694 [Ensete ventricosum]
MRFEGARSPFPLIWRKISVCVELRGVVGGCERLMSSPSILLLDGPEVGPRGCSIRGRFCSSCFSMIKVSAAMKWFALCIISGTVVGGFLTKDQNSLDGCIPIRKAWITREGCASRIAHVSVTNLLMNWVSGSSLPWAMPRSEAAVGFGRALARKFCSSSFASWSKEIMDAGWRRMYYIRAGPLKVLVGIGLSYISEAKGDLCLEFSPASSFDLVTSFYTSSSRLFMRRSCIRNELVESDDKMSGSRGVCSSPRCGAIDFSYTIKGVSDRASGGFCSVGPGRAGAECSRDPPWLVEGRWGSYWGGAIVWAS